MQRIDKRIDTPRAATAALCTALALALPGGWPLAASAQAQVRLTGDSPPETAATQPAGAASRTATPPVIAPDAAGAQVGDVTRRLLSAQADSSVAGPLLPMLGAAATVAYQRYLDSFSHRIPEFFQARVQAGSGMDAPAR